MNKEFNTTYTGVYSVPNYYFNNGVEVKLCCSSIGTNCRYLKILREIKEKFEKEVEKLGKGKLKDV